MTIDRKYSDCANMSCKQTKRKSCFTAKNANDRVAYECPNSDRDQYFDFRKLFNPGVYYAYLGGIDLPEKIKVV